MRLELYNTLIKINKQLKQQEFYHLINRGGCGFFAEIVASSLIKYKITFSILTQIQVDASINHVLIQFNSPAVCWYDSEGIEIDIHEYECYGELNFNEVTLSELIKINENDRWRPTFTRGSIPTIKQIVNKCFDDYR